MASMFPEVTIRVTAECLDLTPLWDTVIVDNEGFMDYALADPAQEPSNVGGLRAQQALHTAIIHQLFTDKWSKANEVKAEQDPRGWWGDVIDAQGYPELGCDLWTLFRGRLSQEVATLAQAYALQACQTFITQGIAAQVDCQAEPNIDNSRLDIAVQLYSDNGSTVYDQKFKFAWDQTAGLVAPAPVTSLGYRPAYRFNDQRNSFYL